MLQYFKTFCEHSDINQKVYENSFGQFLQMQSHLLSRFDNIIIIEQTL